MEKKVLIAGALLLATAAIFWSVGRPAYHRYREARAVRQAREFAKGGDWANASLSARRALELNSRNVEACAIMAGLAEAAHAPQVLEWRQRVAELAPTLENRLSLAATALRIEAPPYPLARQTLEALSQEASGIPFFQVLSAELALKLNRPAEAETHFREAARLEPENELHQLNLAVVRLGASNELEVAAARTTLERLRADTNLGPTALRWLVSDRWEHADLEAARALSSELLSRPSATLDDQLTHLDILRRVNQAAFEDYLALVQKSASTNAAHVHAVSNWMLRNGLVEQSLRWLTNCSPALRAQLPLRLALTDSYAALNDWAGLSHFLECESWGDFEFLRLAWLSRAAEETKMKFAAEAQWRLAVSHAGDRLGPLVSLLKLATAWDRMAEREALLWRIVQRHPGERWALKELGRWYTAESNTRGLNKVQAALVASGSRDVVAKNNLAATSMLLKLELPRAHALAKEIYSEHPEDPVLASTYGYSLHLQGRSREGLAAMEKLNPESLKTPAVALYYGVLLRAAGRSGEAEPYLALARAGHLLPEEQALAATGGSVGR